MERRMDRLMTDKVIQMWCHINSTSDTHKQFQIALQSSQQIKDNFNNL